MQPLNQESLSQAIVTCAENPRYHLIIICKYLRSTNEIVDSFLDIYQREKIPYVKDITKTTYGGRVLFLNNSFIDVCYYNHLKSNCLGVRAHDMLYDASFVNEEELEKLEELFNRCSISYHNEQIPTSKRPPDWTDTVDTSEIDEFLNSFKVTQTNTTLRGTDI